MPTSRMLQAALRKTTEVLAREWGAAASAPEWSEFEWRVARAVAAMHGVSPLLATLLTWRGPDGWHDFLVEQRAHTLARHQRLLELLQRLDTRACETGIVMVALKGVALHELGFYTPGERPMADIDILVKPADATRTARMLVGMGFRASAPNWKEQAFTGPGAVMGRLGEHAENPLKIELHQRLVERLPLALATLTCAVFPAAARPGINGYASLGALLQHLLLHAAGAMVPQTLRLMHLHDIARVAQRMSRADWDDLLARGREVAWWAWPPLQLVARYQPSAVPAFVMAGLRAGCPWLLRSVTGRKALSEVSYSQLRVAAIPGIEWARSPREGLAYIHSRVRPDARQLEAREETLKSQAWAGGAGAQWVRLSQSGRVVRWLRARPARAPTLHALDGAGCRPADPAR